MNRKNFIILGICSFILASCGNASEEEAKRLGFSSKYEMEDVHSKGWHTNAQYRADETARAKRLGFIDMEELHGAESARIMDPIAYRKYKVEEDAKLEAEEAERERQDREAVARQQQQADTPQESASVAQADGGDGSGSSSGFFSRMMGKAGLNQAKNVVTSACENLSSPSGEVSMNQMTQIFGEKKVSEWCECAYNQMSKKFSDEDIANAPSAGALDDTATAIKKSVYSSTAQCMKNSSVPEKGKGLRDSFAGILGLMAK